jgi:Uma2 family endonuclease
MSNMDLVEKLKKAPDAYKIVDEITRMLEAEKAKRKEFYDLVHENVKAEFINGDIIFHSPVKNKHWLASYRICSNLMPYVNSNKLGVVGTEKVMIRCSRNDYEPDIVFFRKEISDAFSPDQMLFPPPDLAVEILSPSTENTDREIKFADYAAHGVAEYWIVDTDQKSIEQYLLEGTQYKLNVKLTGDGILHAKVVEGFSLTIAEVFEKGFNT